MTRKRYYQESVDGYELGILVKDGFSRNKDSDYRHVSVFVWTGDGNMPEFRERSTFVKSSWSRVTSVKRYDHTKEPLFGESEVIDTIPPLAEQVSTAVNEAVCELDRKIEREQELQDEVDAALEAVKEVHES